MSAAPARDAAFLGVPAEGAAQGRMSNPVQVSRRLAPWLVVLCVVLWICSTAWIRPLALPDEGRYAGIAAEMLAKGSWLDPLMDGMPFLHKPPLWYWLTMAAMKVGGINEFTARLASVLAAALMSAGTFWFVRRAAGQGSAVACVMALATTPLFYAGAQYANHDMLVAAWITLTIFFGAEALRRRASGVAWFGMAAAAYACAGAGVMTKGLIGLVLPALTLGAWVLLTRRRGAWAACFWLPGWLLFAALVLPWFAAEQAHHHDFVHYFFVTQQFERYATGHFNNPRPWWYYIEVLGVLGLPWTPALFAAGTRHFFQDPAHRDLRLLMASWLATVFIFFSIPQSKLPGYMLPAVVPLAVLGSQGLLGWLGSRRWVHGAIATAAGAACVALVIGVAHAPRPSSKGLSAYLAAAIAPQDTVAMLDDYVYDLRFYLHRFEPALLADQSWDLSNGSDDTRREIQDAARFAGSSASHILMSREELETRRCTGHTLWIVSDVEAAHRYPWLDGSDPVYRDGHFALWRWPQGCLLRRSR